MMTFYRLVRLIENNSHALASCLLDRVQNSEATPEYTRVPADDLKEREPKRAALYHAVVSFVRAYANIADELEAAGYTVHRGPCR